MNFILSIAEIMYNIIILLCTLYSIESLCNPVNCRINIITIHIFVFLEIHLRFPKVV